MMAADMALPNPQRRDKKIVFSAFLLAISGEECIDLSSR
jgi:hypothetical protein